MTTKSVSAREELESLFRNERTDLFTPVRQNDAAALKKALAKGGSVTDTDTDGNTPLYVATFVDNHEAVEMLLNAGAKPDVPNKNGTTPLIVAAVKLDLTSMRLLLAAGASPTVKDNNHRNALDHLHSGSGMLSGKINASRMAAVAMLVEAIAKEKDDPDTEVFGLRAMHWAALANDDEMLDRLLMMGADPFKPAKNGKTVFECAVRNKKAWAKMLAELAIQFQTELEVLRQKGQLNSSNLIKFFEQKQMRSPEGYTHWTLSEVQPVLDYLLNPPKVEKLVPGMNTRQIERMEKFAVPSTALPALANKAKERAEREWNMQIAIDAAVLLVSGLPTDAILVGLKRKHARAPFGGDWNEQSLNRLMQEFGLFSRKAGAEFREKEGEEIVALIVEGLMQQGVEEDRIIQILISSHMFAPDHAPALVEWLHERFEEAV